MDGELSWEFISRLTGPQLELLRETMMLGDDELERARQQLAAAR